ncbi:DNA polymerase III subunit gamma/tau, partial [Luteimonas sp. Y-2-2-4F]
PKRAAPPSPPAPVAAPAVAPSPAPPRVAVDVDGWPDLVVRLGLRGPLRELAAHTAFVGYADGVLRLSLPESDDHLKTPLLVGQFADALAPHFGAAPTLRFEAEAPAAGETLRARHARERDARQSAAEDAFLNDPDVKRLMTQQGARLVPDSIRPVDER